MAAKNTIVLYNYDFSPFGKRVEAYLALRGIEYALCEVSFVMPRPELELIPVIYRRIPILAVGRDIYLDTRLQLRALEALPGVTAPRLGATNPQDLFIEKLLEKYIEEGPMFGIAAGMVPMEIAQNEQFNKDRQGLFGNKWTKEEIEEGLSESANYMRNVFAFLEETALKDGRDWILSGDGPKMADIEVAFMLDWTTNLAVPKGLITAQAFPKVFAWLDRYRAAVAKAKASANGPTALDGQGAADAILRSDFGQSRVSVDPEDPSGLKEGTEVEFYPADWLTGHRDRGRLVGLTADEVTIATPSKKDVEIHIHAPRAGFKIKETKKN